MDCHFSPLGLENDMTWQRQEKWWGGTLHGNYHGNYSSQSAQQSEGK